MSPLHIFLLVTFAFVCFLLIASVLLQTGKGGGMAGLGGGSSDTAFGAHTANVLQKFTMYCVIAFFVLVVLLSHTSKRELSKDSVMDNFVAPVEKTETPESTTSVSAEAPADATPAAATPAASPTVDTAPTSTPQP